MLGIRAQGVRQKEMITEALLEMHFFRALVDLFKAVYGAHFLKLLKPSPNREAWVGFDQGWARTSLTTEQLFYQLRTGIQQQDQNVPGFYFGYFLQFKTVERMVRRSALMPQHYSPPYLRAELSLKPNRTTGLSQHETLLRLSDIKGASVDYACPMLFDIADIWEGPDITKIRFVQISTSPPGWATNQRHFITLQNETDPNPFWQSEPIETKSYSAKEWVDLHTEIGPRKLSGGEAEALIESSVAEIKRASRKRGIRLDEDRKDFVTAIIPPCFTLIEMGPQ